MIPIMANRSRQLDLDLRPTRRWGGRRAGAGRKRAPNARDPHLRRAPLAARYPCHVTLKMRKGVPSLRTIRLVRELERSLRECRERTRFRVAHYALMGDHAHLIVEAASSRDLACGMKSLGSRLARAVNRVFHYRGAVLADRYHLHVLRTPREVRNAIAYVLLNARRHLAKLGRPLPRVALVGPASSGRWFMGWRACMATAHDPPAVAEPRTWLLRVGWRRAGLIDLAETPGKASRQAPNT